MDQKIDRRVKKTKISLKFAYIHLLEQYSENEITVSMIAQYADLNRATFYAHYSNKEEFINEILYDTLEGLREAILLPFTHKNTIIVNHLAPTTVQIFEYIENNKQVFYALYISTANFKKNLEELFYDIFSNEILMALKSKWDEVNDELFLHYQANATLGLIFYWIQNQFEHSTSYMMKQLTLFSNTQVIELKRL